MAVSVQPLTLPLPWDTLTHSASITRISAHATAFGTHLSKCFFFSGKLNFG